NLAKGLQLVENAHFDVVIAADDGVEFAQLYHIDRSFEFTHAIVGAVEKLALIARWRKAIRAPQPAGLGKLVDAIRKPFVVGDDQPAFAATDDLIGGDAKT